MLLFVLVERLLTVAAAVLEVVALANRLLLLLLALPAQRLSLPFLVLVILVILLVGRRLSSEEISIV